MADAESGEKKTRDLGSLLTVGFAGLNVLVLALGTYLVFSSTIGHEKPSVSEEGLNLEIQEFRESLQKHPVIYTMDPFNTNLNGLPRRLIRLEVNLEMLDEEGFEEVINLGAHARDSIVRILNGKNFKELETVQGKLHLKNQIIAQVNSFLSRGVVKDVYFSDFAVQ